MSLLGFDSTGPATINGLSNINCDTLYSDEIYIDSSTVPINVGDALELARDIMLFMVQQIIPLIH